VTAKMRGDASRSFHAIALEQLQGCSGAMTCSVSDGMILLLQLEELLRPERAPKVEGNERPQDSHEKLSRLSWAQEDLGCSRN